MMELNYGTIFLGLLLNLLFTAVLYGLGPLLFLAFWEKAISNKMLILFCIIYTASAWICWNAILFFALDEWISNGGAAFLWGFGYYFLLKRVLTKRCMFDFSENRTENSKQNTPTTGQVSIKERKKLCGTPFVRAGKTPPEIDTDVVERWYTCPKCGQLVSEGTACDCVSSSPPEQEDTAPLRSEGVSKKTLAVVVVVAAVFCALSTTVGIYLTRDSGYDRGWSDGYDVAKVAYERTISGLKSELEDAESRAEGGYSDFLMTVYAGIVVDGDDKYYHTPSCDKYTKNSGNFNILSAKMMDELGFLPCTDCHSRTDIAFIQKALGT